MATAKRLPIGSWRVQLYAGKPPDGKRQYLSFTQPTQKEAEYKALQHQLHYKEICQDSTNMTLAKAMDKYIAANVKPKIQTFSIFLKFFKATLYAPTWSVQLVEKGPVC